MEKVNTVNEESRSLEHSDSSGSAADTFNKNYEYGKGATICSERSRCSCKCSSVLVDPKIILLKTFIIIL